MDFAFVMAGGSGERFWPLSRASTPKHLLRIFGGRTMLENTVRRIEGIVPAERIFVLTNRAQHAAASAELGFLPEGNVVAEPCRRDTGPACALATALARARDERAVCGLFPADAMIHDTETFRRQSGLAYRAAATGDAIVTFGIPPTHPATGFGYLETGEPRGDGTVTVTRFTEKPELATARAYLEGGRHWWNAGIFFWSADLFLAETRKHAPRLARFVERFPAADRDAYLEAEFPDLPKISVDYALLEKAGSVAAIRAEFDWDDVGSWTALPAHFPADADGNTFLGGVTALDSAGCIGCASSRTVALLGVRDLIVVETPDAILVAHRDRAQDLKSLLPLLPPGLL